MAEDQRAPRAPCGLRKEEKISISRVTLGFSFDLDLKVKTVLTLYIDEMKMFQCHFYGQRPERHVVQFVISCPE